MDDTKGSRDFQCLVEIIESVWSRHSKISMCGDCSISCEEVNLIFEHIMMPAHVDSEIHRLDESRRGPNKDIFCERLLGLDIVQHPQYRAGLLASVFP